MITLIFETRCNTECALNEEDSAKLTQYVEAHNMSIIEAAYELENMGEISLNPTDIPYSVETELVAWDES